MVASLFEPTLLEIITLAMSHTFNNSFIITFQWWFENSGKKKMMIWKFNFYYNYFFGYEELDQLDLKICSPGSGCTAMQQNWKFYYLGTRTPILFFWIIINLNCIRMRVLTIDHKVILLMYYNFIYTEF